MYPAAPPLVHDARGQISRVPFTGYKARERWYNVRPDARLVQTTAREFETWWRYVAPPAGFNERRCVTTGIPIPIMYA
jgi:hypothetical protein